MAATEMEKIRKAEIVMEKIANGVNPVTGEDIVADVTDLDNRSGDGSGWRPFCDCLRVRADRG